MSLTFHILYIAVIVVLLLLLAMVWVAHSRNGAALVRVNCVVAEMLLEQSRYEQVRRRFSEFMKDDRQPLNNNKPGKADFDMNRIYWISSAFQIEKATQILMIDEGPSGYQGLAEAVYRYVNEGRA
jgi:hypothetical protein